MFKRSTQPSKIRRRFNLQILQVDGTPDMVLLGTIAFLTLFGLIMVYSSSFISTQNPFHYFIRQSIWIIIGSICGFFAYIIDYRFLQKLILPGLIISVILLVLVLIPGVSQEVEGARRWIDLKFFDLQPSEIVKLTFTIYLASWAAKQKPNEKLTYENMKKHLREQFAPFGAILGLICILILAEPDLDTTVVIGFTAMVVYFFAGQDRIHTLGTGFIVVLLLITATFAAILAPYRFGRVKTYVEFLQTGKVAEPLGSGYQLRNILIAVGSGGVFGVGYGESKQKYHYLGVTAFSDNIFAVIAEEFGLLGSSILVGGYFFILLRGFKIALCIEDRFPRLLIAGLTVWIVLQAYLHISSNIGLIPVSGITLPFVSYGGSSTITILTTAGIMLNVSRHAKDLNTRGISTNSKSIATKSTDSPITKYQQ